MNNLKKVQSIELEMFKFFHSFCIENSLTYYAVGGTLLGAVRHGGFIPWDDDIDLAMPREDYEKFVLLAKTCLPEYLDLLPNPANLNILQLVDLRTKIRVGKIESNVFIDIFPLDGYPNNRVMKFIHDKRILFYRMLCKLSVIDILEEHDRGLVENLIVKVTKLLKLNKLLNTKNLLDKLHGIVKNYSFSKSINVGNVLGRYRNKEIVNKTIFGKPKLIKFEDFEINAPEYDKEYLTAIYNNFMELPPVDKRVAHNVEILDKDDKND